MSLSVFGTWHREYNEERPRAIHLSELGICRRIDSLARR